MSIFKIGDRVRVIDNGDFGTVDRADPDGTFRVKIGLAYWWFDAHELTLADSQATERPQERVNGVDEVEVTWEEFEPPKTAPTDPVNHPSHYASNPATCTNCGAGIECIQITEHMGFNLGNAIKYVWRADLKNDALEDLRKAEWYIRREIQKRERA